MKDHYQNDAVDAQALTSRLKRIQKSHSTPNNGDAVARLPRLSRSGTSSSDSSMYPMPAFRKSQTSSTSGSNEVSRLEVIRTIPTSQVHRESVEIGQGEFSKPRIRRRRESNQSTKSQKEFQHYGRHANSWLFNDFSITDTIKKGWGKAFAKNENEEKDT